MSDDGPKLVAIDPEPPGQQVIETLQDVLEKAERGELSAVCVVYVDREGFANNHHSELPNVSTMLGALMRCANRIMNED